MISAAGSSSHAQIASIKEENLMRIAAVLVGAGVLLGSVAASAQSNQQVEARYSHDYNQCMATGDAAQGVTSGMRDCTGLEIIRQDARLNQAYKMVMTGLNPQQKVVLRTSERNWISQRDTRCHRAYASEKGGTLAGLIYSECILDETIKRTMWLENYRG